MTYEEWRRVHGPNPKHLTSAEWEARKESQRMNRLERELDKAGNPHDRHICNNDPHDPWSVCTLLNKTAGEKVYDELLGREETRYEREQLGLDESGAA